MNYTTLQADVAEYLNRTDLTTPIVKFIEKARVRIGRDLRSLEQEVTATLVTPGSGRFTLPADFIEMRRAASSGIPLRSVGQHEMEYWTSLTSPQVYAINGRTFWCPGATTVDITYIRQEATLTTGGTEHPTMAAHPQLWTWASLAEAGLFLRDWELMDRMTALYMQEVLDVNRAAERGRQGTAPAVVNSDAYSTFMDPVN